MVDRQWARRHLILELRGLCVPSMQRECIVCSLLSPERQGEITLELWTLLSISGISISHHFSSGPEITL